ncbi:uncharacterized protein LOC123556242 isoform X2 [Mercenaria mercenaria]|uniref:uncharacterized protein LOC123556242 isoform X2 n=1 Tax=Mercenaria mercenaria TaxID=6596 RepID=UPI00234E6CB2|nr:uncharacterized protein LOC123556242 isoform X2 [Mercenaria mercenaria]
MGKNYFQHGVVNTEVKVCFSFLDKYDIIVASRVLLMMNLLHLLNTLGICIPEKSKLPMLEQIGQVNGKEVVNALKNGASLKITVDNIDGRIKAYQVRIGSGNRDFHYTHWSVIIDRLLPIDLPDLNQEPKVLTVNGPDPSKFYLNTEEHKALRDTFTWLIERILVEEFPAFSSLTVPAVLDHKYRDIVDRPSQVFPMFKIIKKFYSTESSREVGSLAHYRAVLHRTNVNGQVKSGGYEAHKDFVFTVARAMVVELALETFGADTKADMEQNVPQRIKFWSQKKKQKWLDDKVKSIVDLVFREIKPRKDVRIFINHRGTTYAANIPASHVGQTVSIPINGETLQIEVPLPVDGPLDPQEDDVYKYSLSFLRVALDFMLLYHVIKSGDIDTLTLLLKRFIALFVALTSYKSKYAIECINTLTKTEFVLSEYESIRVKLGLLVNSKGKPAGNKPADMQQENNIKLVKNVIRGLGAGKTDKAMERSSKAGPAVSQLVNGLDKSVHSKLKDRHSKKSLEDDMTVLHDRMRVLRPFQVHADRLLPSFHAVSSNVVSVINKVKLDDFIKRHSSRAISKIYLEQEEENVDD